jgi:transcriptional regulator with XRE-family HTH domain
MPLEYNSIMSNDFKNLLRIRRLALELSQAELGKMCGVSGKIISCCESGEEGCPHDRLPALIKALGFKGQEAESFRIKAIRAKAYIHKEARPYIDDMEKDLFNFGSALLLSTSMLEEKGIKLPKPLADTVDTLRNNLFGAAIPIRRSK